LELRTPSFGGKLISVRRQDRRRERGDRKLAASPDGQLPHLGLWVVLSVPAECPRLPVEPQARVPALSRARTEPAYQTAQTAGSADARAVDGTDPGQPGVVDGLHA